MRRCLQLAELGAGKVAPNPMVGAVLVYNNKIIGEGYHEIFGGPHAEVNAVKDAIQKENYELICQSTLYVSLEPCSHQGKTPPCTDLIIKNNIPKVVIGCRDPFPEVNGRGVKQLKEAGIEIEEGMMEDECKEINKRFFIFHKQHRPYIILKWAESADGKLAPSGSPKVGARFQISNEYTNRLVHKWRSEEAAILIGTNTALMDDPQLTTRLWKGKDPMRLVIDMNLKLPRSLKIFNDEANTIIFNTRRNDGHGQIRFYEVTEDVSLVHQIVNALYHLKIQSVIVEGGARLLQSFIDEGMWDEARVIRNEELVIRNGLNAPVLQHFTTIAEQKIFTDQITTFKRVAS